MRKYLMISIILLLSSVLLAQKHSIGINLNVIHNFNYVDKNFDEEETVRLPLHRLQSYGLEYTFTLKNNLGLYSSLVVSYIGTSIRREYEVRLSDGSYSMLRRNVRFNSKTPSLRFGAHWRLKTLNLSIGPSVGYIPEINLGRFTTRVFANESYSPIAESEYIVNKSRLHISLYLNLDLRIARIKRNEIRLSFISNIGLHPIYRTTSRIDNFDNNVMKEIVHNNYGTYLGLGIKVVRSSDQSIKDLFRIKTN